MARNSAQHICSQQAHLAHCHTDSVHVEQVLRQLFDQETRDHTVARVCELQGGLSSLSLVRLCFIINHTPLTMYIKS